MSSLQRIPVLVSLALACLLPPAAGGQPQAEDAAATTAAAPIERWTEWPKLKGSLKSEVTKDIARLRKADTYEMGQQAQAALIQVGGGIIPHLLPKLAKEKDDDASERMRTVLTAVSTAEHTRLLAEEFTHRDEIVRVWAMQRVAAFPDPELQDVAVELYKELEAREGQKRKGSTPAELRAGALLAISTGSLNGLDRLIEATRDDWKEERELLLAALTGVRGAEATQRILTLISAGDRRTQVAGLRMLRSCGDESAMKEIGAYLDSQEADVRKAAINALRCVVDGEEPLEKLSVFEGIERAKQWKVRL